MVDPLTRTGGDALSVRRIRVQTDDETVDVALPSGAAVGDLLPAILDMVGGQPSDGTARAWRLDRPTGGALVESSSLRDNGVLDGELFILAQEGAPPLGVMGLEPGHRVAAAALSSGHAGVTLLGLTCLLLAGVAAVALAWVGVSTHSVSHLIVAAVGAGAAGATAVAAGYPTVCCLTAVFLCATTGFLTVPSGPAVPNVLLASAAALAASLLALRMCGRPSRALTATATYSGLLVIVTVAPLPLARVGAALSVASLGMLALAPRLAVLASRLGPDQRSDGLAVRAEAGHAVLTGVVAGCAAGTLSGAVLLAATDDSTPLGTITFPMVVGLVLLLRARTYVDPPRRLTLTNAGLGCGLTSFVIIVSTHPDLGGWGCSALIGTALIVGRPTRLNPGMVRILDRLEYVALAAVIPVALWVGGVYTLVGDVRSS